MRSFSACLPDLRRPPLSAFLAVLALSMLPAACRDEKIPASGEAQITPAGPGVRALLDGLNDGDMLGDLKVLRVYTVWEGAIRIETSDEAGHTQRLMVTLVGDGPLPPLTSKKYAIFFGSRMPDAGAPPTPERVSKAMEALADRLKKTEDGTAQPPGMTAYGSVRTAL